MAKQNIDIGVEGNDGTGDSIRESFRKVNENFSEIYAVFGLGGQISLLDLGDTPNTYDGQTNKVPVVNDTETGIVFLDLASDNALDPTDIDTIGFDFSEEGKLVLKINAIDISRDIFPTLGGPLNAATQPIANVAEINQSSVDLWRASHGEDIEIGDLVINKRYADSNYQEKQRAGAGIRLDPEPANRDFYTKTIESFNSFGNPVITAHGLDDQYLGAPFIFRTTNPSDLPTNIVDEQTVYIRIVDQNTLTFHTSEADAINNSSRIILSGGTGTFTIVDADYDTTLEGNWLSTVALPRESVTRRQGDRMEGTLFLNDHPGDLAGLGTDIGGSDDLQAATKLYVDKGTPTSQVNLYVATDGDDRQTYTPPGKEGRSPSWAYATVNAAARKAEEIILSAPIEPGPYMQTITFGGGLEPSLVTTAGFTAPPVSRPNFSILISENVEFIQQEVLAFIETTYPTFEYNLDTCARDVEFIVNSVRLDILLGDNANYLSRWAGIRYYSNPSARKAIGEQLVETVASIEHTKKLIRDIVKGVTVGSSNSVAGTLYQNRYTQFTNAALIPDEFTAENVASATDAKFDIVLGIINGPTPGPLDAPTVVDGATTYKINLSNGSYGFVDQGNPTNTDIIPGKVVVGKESGAVGRIIAYDYDANPDTVLPADNDVIELQLLEPVEFIPGEELEYGNFVRETQCSIRIESGIYEEDYPIRVPANVSIKGDEFRRVIIRPKKRISQSRYTNTFFYRDKQFDNLTIVSSQITQLSSIIGGAPNGTRAGASGTYTGVTPTTVTTIDPITSAVTVSEGTSGNGERATFDITVNANGSVLLSSVTINNPGTGYLVGDTITISDDDIGATGAPDLTFTVGEISGGKPYINPLTNDIDGYFGYHYLKYPNRLKNVGEGYQNAGGAVIASRILEDNKEFIAEQVVQYIAATYPSLTFAQGKCNRDVRLIVEAMAKDFVLGGNENVLEAQGEYYYGALPKDGSQNGATEDGINQIYTILQGLFANAQPATIYGDVNLIEYPQADLFNGEAEATALAMSLNFINTINFAFNDDYNPPLPNDEMDVFLMNDATILRNMTVQGHGGFLCTLDPYGQVLTKSPYIQTGSSFSRSQNKQVFSGGMFVDAFTGNTAVQVVATGRPSDGSPVPDVTATPDPFVLQVKSLGSPEDPQGLYVRRPETPCPFYVDGRRFQVNAVINYDPDEGTAVLLLDKNSNPDALGIGQGFTGTTSNLQTGVDLDSVAPFEFNEAKCARDTGLILDAVGLDIALGSNYRAVTAGLSYQRANADVVTAQQLAQTTAAINFAKSEVLALTAVDADVTAETRATAAFDEVVDILNNGVVSTDAAADPLTFPTPATQPTTNANDASVILQANKAFIVAQVTSFITTNYPSLTYNSTKCERDVGYIVDALSYDVLYGGNSGTLINARSYFVGTAGQLGNTDEETATVAAYTDLQTIVSEVVQGTRAGQPVTANPATGTEATIVSNLVGIIKDVIELDTLELLPAEVTPNLTSLSVGAALISANVDISNNRALIVARTVQSIDAPIPITLQTAGNRSMLGNDFTQVNDLGYGLVVVNGALSEMVSMFTYYCHASYYAKNGSEIRSLTGSSCYGNYGLVAEGSDPNEIPDGISTRDDMNNPAKTFTADIILTCSDNVTTVAGETITQASTGATGTVTISSNTRTIYLTDVSNVFDTTNQLTGSTSGALGASSVPSEVDTSGYANDEEQLFGHLYDFEYLPSNRGEFDIYHPVKDIFARYEIANVVDTGTTVGEISGFGDSISITYAGINLGTGTGATFKVSKTITAGYSVTGVLLGEDYEVGDTITISGADLGGATPANDVVITATEVDSNGGFKTFTFTGTIAITDDTPRYNGKIIKVNFATGDGQFSQNGILETGGIPHGTYVQVRNNQTFIFEDIARPDILTIRPSTAVIFRENPDTVYRSISFLTADALGNELSEDTTLAGFDSTYDYVRLVVDTVNAQNTKGTVLDLDSNPLTGGTTLGNTAGDTTVAVVRIYEENELRRINNNLITPGDFRPSDFNGTGELPMITTWDGKKHTISNYRGVQIDPVSGNHEIQAIPSESDDYGIVEIGDVSDLQYPARAAGLASTLVLGTVVPILRSGLQAGSPGTVTIAISTCRATGHDFLDVGTGGFNTSNYPNVIFGLPRAPDQSNEVDERGKGRVFYVSTDQNGIFRVGRFFSVDQGTGTVSFSASIALSDVDGLGFKRGVVVTEFSTDTAMTDNASDTVPTESAVRGYVNRRLGFDQTGAAITNKIGPGVLAPNGSVPMTADINAAGNTITNISTPVSDSDTANKAYVDNSQGNNDTLPDLRDIDINDYDEGQLLVSTSLKKIIIDADLITTSGPGAAYKPGQTISGNLSGATGTVVDVQETQGFEGDIIVITYTPLTGDFSSGAPVGQDTVSVSGVVNGPCIDGPLSEWANGVPSADSDVVITTERFVTTDGSGNPTDRYTEVSIQLATETIVNADVSPTAAVAQSKLNLNAASLRANATGISQSDLGVASFKDTEFTATNGFIELQTSSNTSTGIAPEKLQHISTDNVLGRSIAGDGSVSAIPFATVISEGGGLEDGDFTSLIAAGTDAGEALIKTGTGTYGISNVTVAGEPNSIVKTNIDGSIQVNSLILGGDSNYEVLSLDTTELLLKTPGQGTILTATGGSAGTGGSPSDPGYIAPTYPDLEIPGSVNIGGTGVTESTLQASSVLGGQSNLAVDWIYSSFIEAPGEKGLASTGIAIGGNTGKTTAGQIAIVASDSGTSTSVTPFIFNKDGVVPDFDNIYNIGAPTKKYNTVYASVFNGTATEALYADLAENYLADDKYAPGTVLVLGGEEEVTTTNIKEDHRVAGVVTTNPAHLMNSALQGEHVVGVALQGRVPCNVIGKVQKGDILITSAIPGYAVVNNQPKIGTIIGKAVSSKDDSERGTVEVLVGK
jgi:hypothetical protein